MGDDTNLCLVCRANIRILVKDTVAAKNGYGPYVEPVSVDINSQGAQRLSSNACLLTPAGGAVLTGNPGVPTLAAQNAATLAVQNAATGYCSKLCMWHLHACM
jgi:hypothetical protein